MPQIDLDLADGRRDRQTDGQSFHIIGCHPIIIVIVQRKNSMQRAGEREACIFVDISFLQT